MPLLIILITLSSCIQQKDANSTALAALLYPQEVIVDESYTLLENMNGYMMTFERDSTKLSFCFEVPKESCTPSLFINITDSQTLQNRIDDLSFLALNFTNCTAYTPELTNLYNSLQVPTSTFIERISSYPGPMDESDFTISYRESCFDESIKVEQSSVFERYFTAEEFYSQNRIEVELAWMTGTTEQCLIDLSQTQTTIDLSFAVRDMKQNSPTLFPFALLGSVTEPYTYEDIGLTPENQAPDEEPDSEEPKIPLMSDREREVIKSYLQEMENLEMMTEDFWKKSSRESMKALSEIPYTDEQIEEHLNDFFANETPIPEPPRETPEEVLRRESAAADRYYDRIKEKFPTLSNKRLIQIRVHLTLALVLIRFQNDFNDPNGLTPEILDMAKDKAVKFRQEINTELLKRGVTSL